MTEKEVAKTWDNIWKEIKEAPAWDNLSQSILNILSNEIINLKNRKILEVGSGTGRISLKLSSSGASVFLLDISRNALSLSKKFFSKKHLRGNFIRGSVTKLPFKANTFDVVWSSGLLEHFNSDDQKKIVAEKLNVCKIGGLCIEILPNRHAIIYNFCRIVSMRLGRWPYGSEQPFSRKNMLPLLQSELITSHKWMVRAYSIGFREQFYFLKLLPHGETLYRLFTLVQKLIPRFWSALEKYADGYLIAFVIRIK